ncbi:MAG: AbfB domain-containing protein, partial [Dolichospermum sp.]
MKKIDLSISLVATIATTTFFLPLQSSLAQTIFARFESVNYPNRYIRHRNWQGYIEPISTDLDQLDSSFKIRTGLSDPNCVSLESKNYPNHWSGQYQSNLCLVERNLLLLNFA